MAPDAKNTSVTPLSQSELEDLLHEQLRQAVRFALVTVLEAEVEAFIGAARYERGATRRDQRNGYSTRSLGTTVGPIDDLPVPRTRQGFRTQLFERYQRRRAELDAAISDMFIRGVSTRGVGQVVEHLTGTIPSASTVSRVFHTLEEEYTAWKKRPLAARYEYAFADGTYFTVIYDQDGCKMPILTVVGVRPDGVREVLGFRVGDRGKTP
jgi:putative transposase